MPVSRLIYKWLKGIFMNNFEINTNFNNNFNNSIGEFNKIFSNSLNQTSKTLNSAMNFEDIFNAVGENFKDYKKIRKELKQDE